jgi:hypothetical protein
MRLRRGAKAEKVTNEFTQTTSTRTAQGQEESHRAYAQRREKTVSYHKHQDRIDRIDVDVPSPLMEHTIMSSPTRSLEWWLDVSMNEPWVVLVDTAGIEIERYNARYVIRIVWSPGHYQSAKTGVKSD